MHDGKGFLVRWGKTIVDALNRELVPNDPSQVKVRSAFLQFDMASGEILPLSGSASEAERSNILISMAAFGMKQLGLQTGDMGFPMDDVTPAKLFSLFDGLSSSQSGTNIYTSTSVVTPSADGTEIMAGAVRLEDHLCNRWWLPPSSQLPWALDVPRGGSISQRPFDVTLVCGGHSRRVDWYANAWEAVVKAGAASKPKVLDFRGHTVHYQVAFLDPDDEAQMALNGQILLYRHARFTCMEALPRKGGSAVLANAAECMQANNKMEAAGPKEFKRLYDMLQPIYDGGWPVDKADMTLQSKGTMRTLLGENMAVLASCHDFEWQEGKEDFAVNAVFPACLPALYSAAAVYAMAHHPEVVEEREAREKAEAARAERAKRTPTKAPRPAALGPGSPEVVDRAARKRKAVQPYQPEAPSGVAKGGKKKKSTVSNAAPSSTATLKKIQAWSLRPVLTGMPTSCQSRACRSTCASSSSTCSMT